MTAKFTQIAETLRLAILAGDYGTDGQLPTEHALADAHNVSRNTAREALIALVRDGLIIARRPRGYFVRSAAPPPYDHAQVDMDSGANTSPVVMQVPTDIAAWTSWPADTSVVLRKWVTEDGETYRKVFWPLDIATGTELLLPRLSRPDVEILADLLGPDLALDADDSMTPAALNRESADALDAPITTPAMRILSRWRRAGQEVVRASLTIAINMQTTTHRRVR